MCGILGAFGTRLPEQSDFKHALDTLAHRGPDGEGIFATPMCMLGHRRLSVIDLSTGDQPMHSADGRYSIIFNGEIYNYRELRAELEGKYPFRTKSDTEVILAGYTVWGKEVVHKLGGMFAFAIVDHHAQELFLARDPLGIKPLVYSVQSGVLLFASEIKALRAFPGVGRGIDEARMPEFFMLKHIPAPHTIYRDIKKLPAGHYMMARIRGQVVEVEEPVAYWNILDPGSPPSASPGMTEGAVAGRVRQWLLESVKQHMVSDVPIGAFLSGGIDSSAIVWAMSQFTRPKTFTVSFKEIHDPDVEYARLVAKQFNTDHTEILLDLNVNAVFSSVIRQFDEPFADPATITNWYVAKATSEHVKVALSGDGGDELFFGYRSYAALGRWNWLAKLCPWWDPTAFIARRYFGGDRRVQKVFKDLQACSASFKGLETYRDLRLATRMMDLAYTLPEYYLRKVDGVTMMNSLEVRVPYLERSFVEKILPFPVSAHYDKRVGKALLRQAMAGVLPEAVLTRGKQGFIRPWKTLFAGSMRDVLRERLLSQAMRDSGWFNMDSIRFLLLDHTEGRRDNSAILWRLLVFSEWLEGQSK